MDNNSLSILITGDLMVNQNYQISKLDKEIIDFFTNSDVNIVNLEAPVTDSLSKIEKTGPHLKANKESTLNVLNSLKVNVVTLANNHILDYDEAGVIDTLSFCKENNFTPVGAGKDLFHSSEPLVLDTTAGKIAVVNFAENEWASAGQSSAGANPMDIVENSRKIRFAKEVADFVLVIIHGGHEYYNLPSPRMQDQYRFYAEQGANIVIGHHPHCISGYEVYNGVPIYYSLGNFLFTKSSTYKDWYTGLILEIQIVNGKLSSKIHPVVQEKENFKLSFPEIENKDRVLKEIEFYSKIINDRTRLEDEWRVYVNTKHETYLRYLSPISSIKNRYLRAFLNKLGVKMLSRTGMALSLNLMRCEAHRDISKEVIKKHLSK